MVPRPPGRGTAASSLAARGLPEVDAGVDGVLVDLAQLVVGEVQALERAERVVELGDARGADQRRGHARVAQDPGDRHLRERLAAPLGDLVERAHVLEALLGEHVLAEEDALGGARVLRHPVEVARGEHALGERRERDAADALVLEHAEQVLLDPAVEHRVARLVDQQRRAHLAQDPHRLARALARVGGDAGVERLALADRAVERAHRLVERRLGVEPVRVEDVDVVQAHPRQALVQRREQVLARAPLAVRPRPHVVAGLGGDDQLVAEGREVLAEDAPEVQLGRAGRRAVVVGEVEVADAAVERAPQHRALGLERLVVAEVVPEAERDRRQLDAAAPAAAVGRLLVAVVSGDVGHGAHRGSR
jgi:hypothetical protein